MKNLSGALLFSQQLVVSAQRHGSTRSKSARISTLQEYRAHAAIPYLDSLIENINQGFTDEAVKILYAASIFDPAEGTIHTFSPLLDHD